MAWLCCWAAWLCCSFFRFLKDAGLKTLFRADDDYGLPLVIGGAEVSLWDMAALFRGLGAGGRFAPLQYLASTPAAPVAGAALISPGACYLTLNVLRQRGQLLQTPPHRPSCRARAEDQPLKILYPQSNARLRLARDFGAAAQQVILRAAHTDKDRILYWYLDHDFLGTTTDRHTRPAALDKGWHTLEIVDGNGNRDRTRFYASSPATNSRDRP